MDIFILVLVCWFGQWRMSSRGELKFLWTDVDPVKFFENLQAEGWIYFFVERVVPSNATAHHMADSY